MVRHLNAVAPKPTVSGPNFALLDKEKIARIKMMRGDNMRKFALELEKILYELEPEELMKPVEKRLTTVVKIEFIKQDEAKRTAGATIRKALGSRVRRNLARARRNRNSSAMMQQPDLEHNSSDPFSYDSD
ncbi:hypothetical protein Q1695_012627 [Nippostrongylus brasiliensis]|nr:hypothetical protein Q1695_012627 [Nippostrongylus brasiliensis]